MAVSRRSAVSVAVGVAVSAAVGVVLFQPATTSSVNAGNDATVTATHTHTLAASCDNGDAPTCGWSQAVGTGCTFEAGADSFTCTNNTSPDFDVTCDESEIATLRLCCDTTDCDSMLLTAHTAPVASAGADDAATVDIAYTLDGNCTDDGLPNANRTCGWTQTTGSGCVFETGASSFTCNDASDADFDVTCSAAETAVLTLTCSDGDLSDDDPMTLTVSDGPCDAPIPFYGAGAVCLDDAIDDAQTVVGLAGYSAQYPDVSAAQPIIATQPTPAGSVSVGTLANLEAAVNHSGGMAATCAHGCTITLTADIAGTAELVGPAGADSDSIIDCDGHSIEDVVFANVSHAGSLIRLENCEIQERINCGQGASGEDCDDITIRNSVVGTTDQGSITIAVTSGAHRWLLVNVVGYHRNGMFEFGDGSDLIIANSNFPGRYPMDTSGSWCVREGDWDRFAIIDSQCECEAQRCYRAGSDTATRNGPIFWSSSGVRATSRRSRFINPGTGYMFAHMEANALEYVDRDMSFYLYLDTYSGHSTGTTLDFGGSAAASHHCDLLSLNYGINVRSSTGFASGATTHIDKSEVEALESNANGADTTGGCGTERWNLDTNDANTYAVWSDYDNATPYIGIPAMPAIVDDDFGTLDTRDAAPSVAAGSDDDATEDAAYTLAATVSDDGLPRDQLWCSWTTADDCTFEAGADLFHWDSAGDEDFDITCHSVDASATATLCCDDDGDVSGSDDPVCDSVSLNVQSAASPLALDNFDQTVLASWCLTKTMTAYEGPLIRIQDVDDNAQTDIGCVGSTAGTCDNGGTELDTTAIGTFCDDGATQDCFVATVYDQSGNGDDLTQATEDNMPWLQDNGSVITCGTQSDPCMFFNGNAWSFNGGQGSWLARSDALGLTGNPGIAIYFVTKGDAESDDRFMFDIGGNDGANIGLMSSQTNGGRWSMSTRSASIDFDNNDEGAPPPYATYVLNWPSGGAQVQTVTLYKESHAANSGSLTCDSGCSSTATVNLTNDLTRWGTSTRGASDFNFPWEGWASCVAVADEPDTDDRSDFFTIVGARM